MSNQNTKKSLGIEVALTGEMGMDNFVYLNSSLSLFYFNFLRNLKKNIYDVCTLTPKPHPLPLLRAITLLAVPPLPHPSVCTLLMALSC